MAEAPRRTKYGGHDPARGKRIQNRMQELGLTVTDLARTLARDDPPKGRVSTTGVYNLIAGKPFEDEPRARRVAAALGWTLVQLVGAENVPATAADIESLRRELQERDEFGKVSKLINRLSSEFRGDVTGLRSDVQALTAQFAALMIELQEQGLVGEGQSPSGRTEESGEGDRATETD